MKTGHYFCDDCEDNAFGAVCRTCNSPARWVRPTVAAPVRRRRVKRAQPGADFTALFASMRERVAATAPGLLVK